MGVADPKDRRPKKDEPAPARPPICPYTREAHDYQLVQEDDELVMKCSGCGVSYFA
jgi:hypothetical protein